MEGNRPVIKLSPMCDRHRSMLIHKAGYRPKDPWMALEIATQIVLFQGLSCDDKIHERLKGDLTRINEIGCPACCRPDLLKQVIEVAKSKDLGRIKELGERWIKNYEILNRKH